MRSPELLTSDSIDAAWRHRLTWLRRWLAICGLLLVAATWRLWTPQTVFPQVPFVGALREAPAWLDWIGLTGLLIALLGLLMTQGERGASAPWFNRRKERVQRAIEAQTAPLSPDPSPQGEGDRNRGVLRAFVALFVASLVLLVLLDQHRFQPWAYQFAIVVVVLAFVPPTRAASLLRLLTVGIYFWSAVSKFDDTFLHGLGPELLRGLLTAFHLEPRWMRPEVATLLTWAFPLGELAVAVLLAFRTTRTVGLVGAVAMHVLLLATLGPFGLNHEPGVLLWNVYFIGQDLLLFRPVASGGRQPAGTSERSPIAPTSVPLSLGRGVRDEGSDGGRQAPCILSSAHREERGQETRAAAGHPLTPAPLPRGEGDRNRERQEAIGRTGRLTPPARLAQLLVYAAVVLPVLEPFGLLDHWPGWAVYAPGAERVTLLIDGDAADRLPEEVRKHLGPPDFLTDARVLRTDLWSLDSLSTPIYPQGRFRAGVALGVVERYGLQQSARLVVESRADRFTGEREATSFVGAEEIREYAESFRLNALPRKLGD